MLLRRCLLLPFALSCLCAHALELTAGDLRVVFTGPDDRFLGRIEDVATGLRFRGDDPAATFHIALRDAAGTGHLLKAQTAASVTCEATADRVLHRFHFADPEAEVVTRAEVVDGAVQFTLQVRALDAGVVIGEVIYPFLTSMGRPEGDQPDDYVLYPYASGRRMTPRRPAYTWGGGNAYPSAYCTMQMVGYHLQEGRCLYATTPDPLCYTKTYLYGGDGQSFYWGFNHFPEEMWHTTEYATPYPVRFKLVWSSDVCSSDLPALPPRPAPGHPQLRVVSAGQRQCWRCGQGGGPADCQPRPARRSYSGPHVHVAPEDLAHGCSLPRLRPAPAGLS